MCDEDDNESDEDDEDEDANAEGDEGPDEVTLVVVSLKLPLLLAWLPLVRLPFKLDEMKYSQSKSASAGMSVRLLLNCSTTIGDEK